MSKPKKKVQRKTQRWAILLVFLCTFITSTAQLLLKLGMNKFQLDWLHILTNFPLLGGFFLYGLGAVLLIIALRGGELSVLYPFIATSFVWVALFSSFYFHESMNVSKLTGIAFIIAGIACIGKGSS